MKHILTILGLMVISFTANVSLAANGSNKPITGSATCYVNLGQRPIMGTYDEKELAAGRRSFQSTLNASMTIPADYTLEEILNNKYGVTRSNQEKLNTTVTMDYTYAPVDHTYAGSNQADIKIDISSKDEPKCNQEYNFTLSVGQSNYVEFHQPTAKSCKAWEVVRIQCLVSASDGAKAQ